MLGVIASLAISALLAALPAGNEPSPTPVPPGIVATFVSLAEKGGTSLVTFDNNGAQTTMPLAPDAIVRERAIGGSWMTVTATDLRPGSPVVVFVRGTTVIQIDTLYASVATRFVLVKNGYGVTPSGKIYKLLGRTQNAAATLPHGAYVLLRVDPKTEAAFDLIASTTPFVDALAQATKIIVTVEVLVPVNTPPSDVVYMTTDALSWTPNAIRMSPLPGNRWTVSLSLTGGTLLKYKYTRGSWATDERNPAGNEIANRTLTVPPTGEAQTVKDVVARWADRSS